MTLCELLQKTKYNQKFYCYVTNNYDQNLSIGAGVRQELLDEEINEDLFDHLLDEVEMITVAADGALVVRTVDKYFNTPLQEQFNKEYAAKWNPLDKSSRPFKFSCELEDWGP